MEHTQAIGMINAANQVNLIYWLSWVLGLRVMCFLVNVKGKRLKPGEVD